MTTGHEQGHQYDDDDDDGDDDDYETMKATLGCIGAIKNKIARGTCSKDSVTVCLYRAVAKNQDFLVVVLLFSAVKKTLKSPSKLQSSLRVAFVRLRSNRNLLFSGNLDFLCLHFINISTAATPTIAPMTPPTTPNVMFSFFLSRKEQSCK